MQLDAIPGKLATCEGVAHFDVATHDYAQVIQILDFEIYEAQDLGGLTTDRFHKTLHMKEACKAKAFSTAQIFPRIRKLHLSLTRHSLMPSYAPKAMQCYLEACSHQTQRP